MTHNLINLGPKIALFEPDIPQNTAAIMRTCACLGANLEIIEPCGFSFNDKRFKRVVMDYMDQKNISFFKSLDHFLDFKKNQKIVLMTTKATTSFTKFNFDINDTIIFGRESSGVPEKLHRLIKYRLKIPMKGDKRSLNIATSVAIVLTECLRQNDNI
mgnify:CR=1 FL=1|tara:strand:+ start:852 stop:1325 length:474 start_codon:yes stop_codon:yes gene_type:complete